MKGCKNRNSFKRIICFCLIKDSIVYEIIITVFQFTHCAIENRSMCHAWHTCRRLPTPAIDLIEMKQERNESVHVYSSCTVTHTRADSIWPSWISREPVTWHWCNLAASQSRPYCASVNSHSPMGLVSRQWDAVDWACEQCHPRNSQISSLSAVILALGKARNRREPNLGCRGADRPGWCDALPKTPAWELLNGQAHCRDEADVLVRSLWMWRSHNTQAQSTVSHCQLTSPTGQWLLTDAQ